MSLFKKEGPAEPASLPGPGGATAEGMQLQEMRVSTINYTVVKNSLVHLEWAKERNNYVYQWKMLRASRMSENDVTARLMAAVDDVLPNTTHVNFDKPIKELQFPFFTITVHEIADRPGAQQACEVKLVELLLKINVWA